MPHLSEKILTPSKLSAEGVLFPIHLRAYPGKPIVCMVSREEARDLGGGTQLLIPKEVADKYQPDFGVVAAFRPRLDDRGNVAYAHDLLLKVGMLVAIKPYTGNWYTKHEGFDWIPEGRILKILGTVEDWSENILAAVEL